MLNKIINWLFPLMCMDKYRNHEWVDIIDYYYKKTGKYIDEKPIIKKKEIHYRKCNKCNLSQRWCDWFGWQLYVPIKQRIIEEKLIKDFLEKVNKILKNEQ
jgi:hypothetical protein